MALRSVTISLAIVLGTSMAAAQSNDFTYLDAGKPVGKASFTIEKVKDGYRVQSHLTNSGIPSPAVNGIRIHYYDHNVTHTYKLDTSGNYLSGAIMNEASRGGSSGTTFSPNKSRSSISVGFLRETRTEVGFAIPVPNPNFLLARDYDPSALQAMILTASGHPNGQYLIVAPGRANTPKTYKMGDGITTYGTSTENASLDHVSLKLAGPASGTLDGKPIAVERFHVIFPWGEEFLYTDAAGKLMEADVPDIELKCVRNTFVLTDKELKPDNSHPLDTAPPIP